MPSAYIVPGLRFVAVVAAATALLVALEWRWRIVTRFAAEDGSALNLAVVRIVVMTAIVWQTSLASTLAFAQLDPSLMWAPRGWAHLMPLVSRAPSAITAAYAVFVAAAILGLIGWYTRAACAVAVACAFYLHTIPQFYGKINHNTNYLILFGAILALAPCADALSVDAWRRGLREPPCGPAYGVALKTMMLLLGLAYFFPGAWKVAAGWDHWFSSGNLARLIVAQLHRSPPTALQRALLASPTLLFLGAVGTVVFELGFVFAVLVPRLRPFAALAGLAFHNTIGLVLGIPFGALQCCYVVLIDWRALAGARLDDARVGPPASRPLRVVSTALVAGMVLVGAGHVVRTWPIACFPPFDNAVAPYTTEMALHGVDSAGGAHDWLPGYDATLRGALSGERVNGMIGRMTGDRRELSPARQRALIALWQREPRLPPLRSVTFYADDYALALAPAPWPRLRRTTIGAVEGL